MGALVSQGYFLFDRLITHDDQGRVSIAPEAKLPLCRIIDAFARLVAGYQPVTVALT
ncbi:MAG: hypothetical protein ACRDTC_20925 [Pseudonocardiaceae bacterium]